MLEKFFRPVVAVALPDEANRRLLGRLLELNGYRAVLFDDPALLLKRSRWRRISAIIASLEEQSDPLATLAGIARRHRGVPMQLIPPEGQPWVERFCRLFDAAVIKRPLDWSTLHARLATVQGRRAAAGRPREALHLG